MLNKLLALLLSAGLLLSPIADSTTAYSSGELTANIPITVGKQQAVWEKYTVAQGELKKKFEFSEWGEGPIMANYEEVYLTSYEWLYPDNISNLKIRMPLQNKTAIGGLRVGAIAYQGGGDAVTEIEKTGLHDNNGTLGRAKRRQIKGVNYRDEICGNYIEDVTANINTYPDDGKHTDGFWYVFKNLVED